MKKFTLFLSIALTTLNIQAQNVTIPDANFKKHLVGNSSINTNSDTEIQVSEALVVTRISVRGDTISNLTGIEAFTNLTLLECDTNNITILDLHANIHLDSLSCAQILITSLDVSMLTSLVYLYCPYNTSLNSCTAGSNTSLKWIDIGDTKITSLDLSGYSTLVHLDIVYCTLLASINLSKNTNLTTLLALQTSNLINLDVSLDTALTSLNVTNIFGTSAAKTICVNAKQLASHAGWSKKSNDIYSTTNCLVGIDELSFPAIPKKLLHIYNSVGQEITIDEVSEGVYIYQYNDGSVKKIAKLF